MELSYHHASGKVTRLLSILLPVNQLDVSVRWYIDQLGFEILKIENKQAELVIRDKGVLVPPSLILKETENGHQLNYYKNGLARSMIMMHASNLEGLREKLLASGIEITLPHSDREDDGCGRFIEVTDPSGNVIQVQVNAGEKPAGHTRIEAIFNLEIPVRDVHKSAHFYADVLGFQLIREPDDQLAFAKTGPFYKTRFGYSDVQEFGFFLFRHDQATALHFLTNDGRLQECLVLQADDLGTLHKRLINGGHSVTDLNDLGGTLNFQTVDPDGNRIRIILVNNSGINEGQILEASFGDSYVIQ